MAQLPEQFYAERWHDKLVKHVFCRFPRLKDCAEDIVQETIQKFLELDQEDPVAIADGQLFRRIRQKVEWLCKDVLRRIERRYFQSLYQASSDDSELALEPSDSVPPPSVVLAEKERRQRQISFLSEVFEEFVRWCESPDRPEGHRMKELYERRLRNENPQHIMQAMGMSRANFDQTLKRARNWIDKRLKKEDIHQSVFRTLQHGSPAKICVTVEVRQIDRCAVFQSFEDVLRFVIDEIGALCPSPERLERFRVAGADPRLSDVRYHVLEAGCRLCQP